MADALETRLNTIKQNPQPWHPEILSLLLQLSNQPTYKSDIEDLRRLNQGSTDDAPPLRWEDIAREDGWDQEPELWATTYSGSDTGLESDDDLDTDMIDNDTQAQADDSTDGTSVNEEDAGKKPQDFVITSQDTESFESIRAAQAWRQFKALGAAKSKPGTTAVPESHLLREVLFMLQGLPTTLFGDHGSVSTSTFQMSHVTTETHGSVMMSFAESGKYLGVLRTFVGQNQQVPHIQTLQDCAASQLAELDERISDMQQRLASPTNQQIVSVIAAKEELAPLLEPLYYLTRVVLNAQHERKASTYRHLELLFDEANASQLSGSFRTYDCIARIFVKCFNVYLRPIRHWMDEGHVLSSKETFFIYENTEHVAAGSVWQDRFRLEATDGVLEVPRFLHLAASKIFNAGKNIVLLRLLGRFDGHIDHDEIPLTYEAICPPELEFAPFSELFDAAFERWIQTKYGATSSVLKKILLQDCELHAALQTLSNLYFMADGAAAESVFDRLFEKLDAKSAKWHDRYDLTGLAQEAYPNSASRLDVSVTEEGQLLAPTEARNSVRTALPHIQLRYRVPWALEMVLTEHTMAQYHSIFTLLLQIKRAVFALQKSELGSSASQADLFYACRRNLLWFCSNVQTYLFTIVLGPTSTKLQQDIMSAPDVDGMIASHAKCIKLAVAQSFLGTRLAPIRECVLDTLDMAINLEESDEKTLRRIRDDFSQNLRFITEGLRSGARASNQSLDMLADMLQM